jgi:hypothetical protein
LLFRKVPYSAAVEFLRSLHPVSEVPAVSLFTIFQEANLHGTNCILKFCRHAPCFQSNNERYRFAATEEELSDAVRLLLLCIVYRWELFYLNSLMRRELVKEPVALDVLLDVYNRRLCRHWMPQPTDVLEDVVVLTSSANSLTADQREWRFPIGNDAERVLAARNYMPVPCSWVTELQRYAYLDTPDFERFTGLVFGVFREVLLGLNQLLVHTRRKMWRSACAVTLAR